MSQPNGQSSRDVWPPEGIHERRERVFLLLAGIFLGTLTMLNILGITRFIDLSFEIFGMQCKEIFRYI